MKKILLIAAVAAVLLPIAGRADFVLPLPGTVIDSAGPNPTIAEIAAAFGVSSSDVGIFLYKDNEGGAEEGPLQGAYTTVYNPDANGQVEITWNGPLWAKPTYLIAKDGNVVDVYGWDISGWDGKEKLIVPNPWGGLKEWSHVEFYGAVVPEPSTVLAGALLLLPFGLSVARVVRRNRKA